MERLTIRCGNCVGAIKPEDMGTQRILRKLAEYEDLEEQGLLLRLPCKVGDTIYKIPSKDSYKINVLNGNQIRNKIYEQKVYRIEVSPFCIFLLTEEGLDGVRLDNYKKTWFLTKEEAEAALEKMRGEEHETD